MNTNKNKNSILNAITAMGLTLTNGLFGIIVTRFVIASFGSDFNGLNSTANQIVNVLLILEGGFTLASNVALFSPLTNKDYDTVNAILSATKKKFRRVSLIFLLVGLVAAVGYAFAANSTLPREFIATLITMTVIPAAFNLFYATTYRVLLQSQQREYIINIITICTIGLGHLSNIIMISLGGPMWAVRFITMVFALINSLLIAGYVRKKVSFINLKADPKSEFIVGTSDVMIQKITGVIYNSAPIVFLSISPAGGTALASVYAVYNNVFIMLKGLLHGIIDAPRLSFGQMLTERKREDVWNTFAQYEYAAFSAIYILLTTCCALILPFISLYTDGINDVNYYDMTIAILMVLITVMEMIHIPSGHLINMAGKFKVSKNFQLIACIVLIIGMATGGYFFGVYGMLGAVLLVAVLLAIMEMGYIHLFFFEKKLLKLLRLVLPLLIAGVAICYAELQIPIEINSYFRFLVFGVIFTCINGISAVIIGLIFNRRELLSLIKRVLRLLKIIKK